MFTERQKARIKEMVESGNIETLDAAQEIILAELARGGWATSRRSR